MNEVEYEYNASIALNAFGGSNLKAIQNFIVCIINELADF